jgi:hypothetical protein
LLIGVLQFREGFDDAFIDLIGESIEVREDPVFSGVCLIAFETEKTFQLVDAILAGADVFEFGIVRVAFFLEEDAEVLLDVGVPSNVASFHHVRVMCF